MGGILVDGEWDGPPFFCCLVCFLVLCLGLGVCLLCVLVGSYLGMLVVIGLMCCSGAGECDWV